MPRIFVSSCLIGKKCSYDEKAHTSNSARDLCDRYDWVDVCPEVSAGLECPREIHEIAGGSGKDVLEGRARVVSVSGVDDTEYFLKGAQVALKKAQENHVSVAIMKSRSPSCGKHEIHAGKFDGTMREGPGVTTALLDKNGIKVFTEKEIDQAEKELS